MEHDGELRESADAIVYVLTLRVRSVAHATERCSTSYWLATCCFIHVSKSAWDMTSMKKIFVVVTQPKLGADTLALSDFGWSEM